MWVLALLFVGLVFGAGVLVYRNNQKKAEKLIQEAERAAKKVKEKLKNTKKRSGW